jgi:hypothetical protein
VGRPAKLVRRVLIGCRYRHPWPSPKGQRREPFLIVGLPDRLVVHRAAGRAHQDRSQAATATHGPRPAANRSTLWWPLRKPSVAKALPQAAAHTSGHPGNGRQRRRADSATAAGHTRVSGALTRRTPRQTPGKHRHVRRQGERSKILHIQRDSVAVQAVSCEPVSARVSLLTGKKTGKDAPE